MTTEILRVPFRFILPFHVDCFSSDAKVTGIPYCTTGGYPKVLKLENGKFVIPAWNIDPKSTYDYGMPSLRFSGGRTGTSQFSWKNANGYPQWTGSGNGMYVFKSASKGWVYTTWYLGREPLEVYNEFTDEYTGDDYYTGGIPSFSHEVTLTPCPKILKDEEKKKKRADREAAAQGDNAQSAYQAPQQIKVKLEWDRWEGTNVDSTGCGTYSPAASGLPESANATGNKVLGTPQWKDSKGTLYTRIKSKAYSGYEYGAVHRENSSWVIGSVGSSSGWWVGSEPQAGQSVTFSFTKPSDSEATGDPITLNWDKYVIGVELVDNAYLGEIARWL